MVGQAIYTTVCLCHQAGGL